MGAERTGNACGIPKELPYSPGWRLTTRRQGDTINNSRCTRCSARKARPKAKPLGYCFETSADPCGNTWICACGRCKSEICTARLCMAYWYRIYRKGDDRERFLHHRHFQRGGHLLQVRRAARKSDRPSSACDEHAGTSRYR